MIGTILSTLYTRIPFARRTLYDLVSIGYNEDEPYAYVESENMGVVPKFLPNITLASGLYCEFSLVFKELESDDPDWKKIKKSLVSSHKDSMLTDDKSLFNRDSDGSFKGETHGDNRIVVEGISSDGSSQVLASDSNIFDCAERGYEGYRITLMIFIEKLEKYPGHVLLARRSELFARELIGGYRHMISVFRSLFNIQALRGVTHNKSSQSEYHATTEDARRLIVHFRYLTNGLYEFGSSNLITDLSNGGTTAYCSWLFGDTENYRRVRDSSANSRNVDPIVLDRKLMEYSIYKDIPDFLAGLGMPVQQDPID